ncbi:amidotransferase [Candidatus Anaplasma sp. TIGMIC]|uniref:amidotransferase n=1 Tax=Candidatus Anaplasma sp. TIGMIC TaxID=3020713 RepID=UPI00232AB32B|nr:amidotransferase [Candidatus Anaplasma sp. TIGMIC]
MNTSFFVLTNNMRAVLLQIVFAMALFSFGAHAARTDAIVGLLSTRSSTYDGEYRTAVDVRDLLLRFGAKKVVMIDYNAIMKALGDGASQDAVTDRVEKLLLKHKVDRIFIPGDYYNISSPPLPPVPHRQMVTNSLVDIIRRRHDLRLLAICGGLQGVLHAQNVQISRIDQILNSPEMAESHSVSVLHPRELGASLTRAEAIAGSKLAEIVAGVKGTEKGRAALKFYLPDMHSEGINISKSNMSRLHELGYTISAVADDGIIEGLEDDRGNMLLQMHPEFLLVNMDEKVGHNDEVDLSIEIAAKIIEYFLSR